MTDICRSFATSSKYENIRYSYPICPRRDTYIRQMFSPRSHGDFSSGMSCRVKIPRFSPSRISCYNDSISNLYTNTAIFYPNIRIYTLPEFGLLDSTILPKNPNIGNTTRKPSEFLFFIPSTTNHIVRNDIAYSTAYCVYSAYRI